MRSSTPTPAGSTRQATLRHRERVRIITSSFKRSCRVALYTSRNMGAWFVWGECQHIRTSIEKQSIYLYTIHSSPWSVHEHGMTPIGSISFLPVMFVLPVRKESEIDTRTSWPVGQKRPDMLQTMRYGYLFLLQHN